MPVRPELDLSELDAAPASRPPLDLSQLDEEDDNKKADIMWAGRPTTVGQINEIAQKQQTTPETIKNLGTPLGHFESRLASNVGGQTFLRVGQAVENMGQVAAAEVGRMLNYTEFSKGVYEDMRKRDEFLNYIERNGDVTQVMGERANRIYNGAVRMATQVYTAGAATGAGSAAASVSAPGAMANYSWIAADTWGHSMDEAQRNNFSGNESIGYAALHTVLNTGLAVAIGQAASKAGLTTAEMGASPALQNSTRRMLAGPKSTSLLKRAATELGGWSAQGAEWALIDGASQATDVAFGLRDGIDLDSIVDSAATGVLGRAASGTMKGLKSHFEKMAKQMPDVARGVQAAEADIARGINPFEVKDIKDPVHFAKQTGREPLSKTAHDSYREAMDFYINEARRKGETGGLEKLEQDAAKLHEEQRQQNARREDLKKKAKLNKGKAGESTVSVEPVVENPIRTPEERASFSEKDFLEKVRPPRGQEPIKTTEVAKNPNILAPWEPETRRERSLRVRNRRISEQKDQITRMRESAKADKKLSADQMKASRQLVEENVPAIERDPMYNAQVNANTPKRIGRFLDKLEKYVVKREHNTAKRQLDESFKKAANLRSEFADKVRDIRKGIDFRNFKGKEAAANLKAMADENPNIILTEADRKNIARLGAKPIADMTPAEIRDTAQTIQDLAYQSALQDRLIGRQQSAALQDTADSIAVEAAKAVPFTMASDSIVNQTRKALGIPAPGADVNRAMSSKVMGEFASRPESLLEADPTLRKYAYEDVMEGVHTKNLEFGRIAETFKQALTELGIAQDTSPRATLNTAVDKNYTEHNKWRNQKRVIGGVELSRRQADFIMWQLGDAANMRDARGTRIHIADGNKYLPPLDSKLLTELALFSGDKSAKLIDLAVQTADQVVATRVNPTNEKLTGRPLTLKTGVVPRSIMPEAEYVQLLSKGRSAQAFQSALADSYGHLHHREGGKYQMTVPEGGDFLNAAMTHINRLLQFSHMAVPARNAEMILNHPDSSNAIAKRFGEDGKKLLEGAIRMQVAGKAPTDAGSKQVAAWNSAVAGSFIAGRLSVMVAQFLDTFYAAPHTGGGWKHLAQGSNEMAERSPIDYKKERHDVLLKYSGEYWLRNLSEDVATVQTYGQLTHQGYFEVPTPAEQSMRAPQKAELSLAQDPNYFAAKAAAREHFGLDPNDNTAYIDNPEWGKFVADEWTKKTLRGSTSSHPLELSGALRFARNHPSAAVVMNYMNQTKNIAGLFTSAHIAFDSGNYKRAASMYGGFLAAGVIYAALKESLSERKRGKEDSFAKGTALGFVSNLSEMVPLAGAILSNALREAVGKRSYGDNPVLPHEVLSSSAIAVGKAAHEFEVWVDGGKKPEKLVQRLVEASDALTAFAAPVPVAKDWYKRLSTGDVFPGLSNPEKKKKR